MFEVPQNGLILIPDISGFTEFVNSVEIIHGQHITAELLEAVLEEQSLGLELSEIEGDALLRVRLGPAPSSKELMTQVSGAFRNFYDRIQSMEREIYCSCGACQSVAGLSLKVVGHYGEIGRHRIAGHEKFFGPAIILAHRMLKNRVEKRNYVLFSEALWSPSGEKSPDEWGFRGHEEEYPVFGKVPMQVADMEPFVKGLPPPAVEPPITLGKGFEEEVRISAPFPRVVEHLADNQKWLLWVGGLIRMEGDSAAPNRKGRVHMCVTDSGTLRLTLEEMRRGERDFRVSNRYSPPSPILSAMMVAYVARQEQGHVRVAADVSYDARRGLGWLARAMAVPRLRRIMRANLDNLKRVLEA